MLETYLKVALRNIAKYKLVSLINIVGLAVGLAGCLVIAIWVLNERSYDAFHEDADGIQMVLAQGSFKNNPSTPFPLAEALQAQVPEIEHAGRYMEISDALVGRPGRSFYEYDIYAVDPTFFDIFSYEFLEGAPDTALRDMSSVVLTRSVAEKYFGQDGALGQVLTWNRDRDFTVTGVLADPPGNSTLGFDILLPFAAELKVLEDRGLNCGWGFYAPNTFVRLHAGASREAVEAKISDFLIRRDENEDAHLSLLPFCERRAFFWNSGTYILVFSSIALFLLAIGGINYVNLSTARSAERATEIGIRKVSGAGRQDLVVQLLSESVLQASLAMAVALALVEAFLPLLNENISLDLSLGLVEPLIAIPALLLLTLVVGVAAGAYPAFVLSSLRPVQVISRRPQAGTGHARLRRALVVVQLIIAFSLIVGTQVIHGQMKHLVSMDIGYDRTDLLEVPLRQFGGAHYETLKTELLRGDGILGVSASAARLPYFGWSTGTANWTGRDLEQDLHVYINLVDYDFVETLKLDLVAGRGFSREFPSDANGGFVINEQLARIMGPETAPGSRFELEGRSGSIVGIVRDFHFQPASRSIGPMALYLANDASWIRSMLVRLDPADRDGALQRLAETWGRILPDFPLEHRFMDEKVASVYWQTSRLGALAASFSVLAVAIAGLGMFGLASFTAGRRTRELAIRKVFGGSPMDMGLLLWTEYAGCLVTACLIATAPVYFGLQSWLQNFVYRIDIGIGIFLQALALVAGITLLAVSWQTFEAVRRSPAAVLR